MRDRLRTTGFLVAAAAFALIVIRGFVELPPFGESQPRYGELLNELAVEERRVANAVTAVLFDFRGTDTLGEEFILFAAVAGVSLLLRGLTTEREDAPDDDLPGREIPEESSLVRTAGTTMAALAGGYGLHTIVHAHLTPGGGFQGGVLVASALLLVYLAVDFDAFRRVAPVPRLQIAEALGAGGLAFSAVSGLFLRGSFLSNFLPLGEHGELLSGGLILVLNLFTGLAVLAGTTLLAAEFIRQTVTLRERRWFR